MENGGHPAVNRPGVAFACRRVALELEDKNLAFPNRLSLEGLLHSGPGLQDGGRSMHCPYRVYEFSFW